MKRLISVTLVLTMILTMCACGAKKDDTNSGVATSEAVSSETASSEEVATEATSSEEAGSAEDNEVIKIGVLTMLNVSEEEMEQYRAAEKSALVILGKEGYLKRNSEPLSGKKQIIFYDTLDSMLMALNAGDIYQMMVYYKVGQYLCATNDDLINVYTFDFEKEKNHFANVVLSGHMSNDFSFLMMKGNEALRDEFSNAITDMKADGTLDKLIKEQIDDLVNGGEAKPVAMPTIAGADTVKVAVTGALPPMDFLAADGTPAGFNTAVLAEISQRIGKNIEIVVVDSIGRSAALSSGTVDAVFWTRTNEKSNRYSEMSDEEKAELDVKMKSDMTEEEFETILDIREKIDFDEYRSIDMPEGTICTVPYYSDMLVAVLKK